MVCPLPPRSLFLLAWALDISGGLTACLWLKLDAGKLQNTVVRAISLAEQLRAVCQPNYSWYVNVTISKSSYSLNSGQPRACWTFVRGRRLHARIFPWTGTPLKVTALGWVSKWIGNKCAETLKSFLSNVKDWLYTYNSLDINYWLNLGLGLDPACLKLRQKRV